MRQKIVNGINDPKVKEVMRLKGKQNWEDSDYRERTSKALSEVVKKSWQNPERLEKDRKTREGKKYYNNGFLQTFARECPEGWIEGRLYSKYPKGWKWYNNKIIDVRAPECPEGFIPGRISHHNFKERYERRKLKKQYNNLSLS